MLISFGIVGLFCLSVIVILALDRSRHRDFAEYAVAGRAFGPWFQTMSFLNTWWPGGVFITTVGMAATQGLIASNGVIFSLLSVLVMYLMSGRVWTWASRHQLTTQGDYLKLRFGSQRLAVVTSLIGLVSAIPFLVLGFRTLAYVVLACSDGALGLSTSVAIGAGLLLLRQYWTIRLGMHGVVISDFWQGIVAYLGGIALILFLIASLLAHHAVDYRAIEAHRLLELAGSGATPGPFYLFSLLFCGMIGGWCWPSIFVRLYTANSIRSIKKSAVISTPISLLLGQGLVALGILASGLAAVKANPDMGWFALCRIFGGPALVGLAGTVVVAATMGSVDGGIQAMGAQITRDLLHPGHHQGGQSHGEGDAMPSIAVTQLAMLAVTVVAAGLACLHLPQLFQLAIMAYQGIIQLAVPLYCGIAWKRGTARGAVLGVSAGFLIAVALQIAYPTSTLPWAGGLTTGIVGLAVNALIYLGFALFAPVSGEERARVDALFAETRP